MPIVFRPERAVAADVVPFFARGEFQIFYLQDWRDVERQGEGAPRWCASRRELIAAGVDRVVMKQKSSKEFIAFSRSLGDWIKPDRQRHGKKEG